MDSALGYQDTTRWQFARASAVLLLIVGGAGLFLNGGQLFVWDDPGFMLASVALVAGGAILVVRARRSLRVLDAANKPYLLSEHGVDVMRGRQGFARQVSIAARIALTLFILFGVAFFFLMSAAACGDNTDGYCGNVGRPSDAAMVCAQLAPIFCGAVWAGLVSLRRTHEAESERIDRVVAEGQRQRRNDHPMAGTDRFSWE